MCLNAGFMFLVDHDHLLRAKSFCMPNLFFRNQLIRSISINVQKFSLPTDLEMAHLLHDLHDLQGLLRGPS